MLLTPLLNRCFYKCHVPLAIVSAPGYGKTAMIENWCETNNIPLVKIPASSMNRISFEGETVTNANKTVALILQQAETLKDRGVLFIDELDTARKEVQSALLGFVESRRFPSGKKLGDGVLIVTALNPPEMCGGYLLPELKIHFMWCKMVDSAADFIAWTTGQKDEFDDLPAPAKYVGKPEWLERFRGDPDFEADKKALLKKATDMGMQFTADRNATGNGLVNSPQTMENLLYWCANADEMALWAPAFIDDKSASILAAARNEMTGNDGGGKETER